MLQIGKLDVALEVRQNGMAVFILVKGQEHFLLAFVEIRSVMLSITPRVIFPGVLVIYMAYLPQHILNWLSAQSLKVSCMLWNSFLNWVAKDDGIPLSVSCLIKMISEWHE